MTKKLDFNNLAPPLTEQKQTTQHHIKVEQQVIHLMLNHLDAIKELRDNGFTTDHFDGSNRPLVQSIFDEYDSSNGTRLVTRDNYHNWLTQKYTKAEAFVGIKLYAKCAIGVQADKNDLGLLQGELREAYFARKAQHCLSDFPDECRKDGYEAAVNNLNGRLQKITELNQGDDMLLPCQASTVQMEAVQWLWQDRIPEGKLTLFAGDANVGKSNVSLYVAACVSKGRPFVYSQDQPVKAGKVAIITTEDDQADTIIPRLTAAQANLENIVVFTPNGFNLDNYMTRLEERLDEMGDVRLLIFDPISEYLGRQCDDKSGADIRRILAPLNQMAQERRISIIGILHNNKTKGLSAIHKIAGSHQYAAVARSAFTFANDPNDSDRKLMAPAKNNSSKTSSTLAFRIEEDTSLKNTDGETISTAKVEWDGISDLSADEIVAAQPDGSSKGQAVEWLQNLLADTPMESKHIFEAAKNAGIANATLKRAKEQLGFKAYKQGSVWFWPALNDQENGALTWQDTELEAKANLFCEITNEEDQVETLAVIEPL